MPVVVPAIVAVVGLTLALLLGIGSTTPVEPLSPTGGPGVMGAVDDDGTVVVDFAQPVGLGASGIDGATTATVTLSLAGVEVAKEEAPLVDGAAEYDLGLTGWLVNGPAEATVTVADAEGAVLAESRFVVRNEREPWRTAQVPVLVVAALFGLGAVESQSRRHRRGRVRTTAVVGAGVAGALLGGAAALLWSVRVGQPTTLAGVAGAAGGAALAVGALTVVRARRARRRRLFRRADR